MKYPSTQISLIRSFAALSIAVAGLSLTGCEVEKKQEGEMPKVNVEGGKMPEYDVKTPEVKVESKKKEITVPDVDIVTPKEKREGGNVEPGASAPEPAPAPAQNPPAP